MTLTWKDVAGRVEAPDMSQAASLITQGLTGLGEAMGGPEKRRQAELARQALIIDTQAKGLEQMSAFAGEAAKKEIASNEKKDLKAFSTVQSILEAGARDAARKGVSLNEFLAGNEAWNSLSDGARAYGTNHIGDAHNKGLDLAYRDQQHAYQVKQDEIRNQQWQRTHNLQAENARLAREERAALKAERDALKPKVWKTGNDKTDKAMTRMAAETGNRYIEASGARYADQKISDIGKNYKNLGAASALFDQVNRERVKAGKSEMPVTVLMRTLDTGVGSNNFGDGWNDVDDAAITEALRSAGKLYDTALAGKDYYERLSSKVDAGLRLEQEHVDVGWNRLFPKAPQPVPAKRPSGPSLMDAYEIGRR